MSVLLRTPESVCTLAAYNSPCRWIKSPAGMRTIFSTKAWSRYFGIVKRNSDSYALIMPHGGMILSGAHVSAEAHVSTKAIKLLAEARMDSLLNAYGKAGVPPDDNAFNEI